MADYAALISAAFANSSCPASCRASTPWFQHGKKDVDGRDKLGHDEKNCLTSALILRRIAKAMRLEGWAASCFETPAATLRAGSSA
jgi:hypothetical protein